MKNLAETLATVTPAFHYGFHVGMDRGDRNNPYDLHTDQRREWFQGYATGSFVRGSIFMILSSFEDITNRYDPWAVPGGDDNVTASKSAEYILDTIKRKATE